MTGSTGSTAGTGPRRGLSALAMVAVALLAAILTCALGAASLNWYATAAPGAGLTVRLCAGFTPPPVQFGIAWQSALSSRLSRLGMSPFAACLHLPYAWVTPSLQPLFHFQEWLWP